MRYFDTFRCVGILSVRSSDLLCSSSLHQRVTVSRQTCIILTTYFILRYPRYKKRGNMTQALGRLGMQKKKCSNLWRETTKWGNCPTFTPGLRVMAPSILRATPSILSTSPGLRLFLWTLPVWLVLVIPAVFFPGVVLFLGVARGFVDVPASVFLILVVREGAAGRPWERVWTGILLIFWE